MVVATDRMLYVSTDKGLFRARSNGGGYETEPLTFERYAPMRWPVVVDCDNPRRLYAGTSKSGMFRSDNAGKSWSRSALGTTILNVTFDPVMPSRIYASGAGGNVQSIDSGIIRNCSESIQFSPRSRLLNTEAGPVPTYSSPVRGCWTRDQISL